MVRRTVVDDFVGIVFLIGAAPGAMARAGMVSSRVAEPHKLPLWSAGGEEECGEKREEALVPEGFFHKKVRSLLSGIIIHYQYIEGNKCIT